MFRRVMLGVALSLSLAAGAQAAERVVTVTVDGATIKVPLPEGLCEPIGDYVGFAAQVAALDTFNDTILTAFDCAEMKGGVILAQHYAIMKSPKSARGQAVPRAAIVAEYNKDPEAFRRAINAGANSSAVQDVFTELVDPKAKLSAGLNPVGADVDGVYVAGVLKLTPDPKATPITAAVAMGLTSVQGKVLTWNVYGAGDTGGAVAEQLRIAKASTKALVKAN